MFFCVCSVLCRQRPLRRADHWFRVVRSSVGARGGSFASGTALKARRNFSFT